MLPPSDHDSPPICTHWRWGLRWILAGGCYSSLGVHGDEPLPSVPADCDASSEGNSGDPDRVGANVVGSGPSVEPWHPCYWVWTLAVDWGDVGDPTSVVQGHRVQPQLDLTSADYLGYVVSVYGDLCASEELYWSPNLSHLVDCQMNCAQMYYYGDFLGSEASSRTQLDGIQQLRTYCVHCVSTMSPSPSPCSFDWTNQTHSVHLPALDPTSRQFCAGKSLCTFFIGGKLLKTETIVRSGQTLFQLWYLSGKRHHTDQITNGKCNRSPKTTIGTLGVYPHQKNFSSGMIFFSCETEGIFPLTYHGKSIGFRLKRRRRMYPVDAGKFSSGINTHTRTHGISGEN